MKNLFLKNPSRSLFGLAMVLAGSFAALSSNAQISNTPPPGSNITQVEDVFVLIDQVFNILFWLLIVLASVFIIWAAFNYLTAGGDPEKVKTANQKVIYAAVAVVVAVLAKAIPAVVCNFIGEAGTCDIRPR